MTSRVPSAPLTAFRGRKAGDFPSMPLNRLWRLPAIDSAYAYARARANIPKTKTKTKTITITSTPPPSHAQTQPDRAYSPLPRVFGGKPVVVGQRPKSPVRGSSARTCESVRCVCATR